jgi:small subunit ribosomal protein S6
MTESSHPKLNHYEVVFLIHPDQEDQVPAMTDRYRKMIEDAGGRIHRFEDWGRRPLAYPIQKVQKAHYILMNVETTGQIITDLTSAFRFNDAVIRHLVMQVDKAVTGPSAVIKNKEREEKYAATRTPRSGGYQNDSNESGPPDEAVA